MLRVSIKIIATILLLAVAVRAHTDRPDLKEYIIRNVKNYNAAMDYFNGFLDDINKTSTLRVALITEQGHMLADKLLEVDNKFETFELISDKTKACYTTYRIYVPNDIDILDEIAECSTSCVDDLYHFQQEPKELKKIFVEYYHEVLKTALDDCYTKFANLFSRKAKCTTHVVEKANSYIKSTKHNFNDLMRQAYFQTKKRLREAMQCTFEVIYNAAYTYGRGKILMDQCANATTTNDGAPATQGQYCMKVLDTALGANDSSSPTIANPFIAVDTNEPCVLFNLGKATGTSNTGDAGAGAPAPNADAPAPNGDAAAPNGDAAAPNGDAASPNGDAAAPNGDAAAPNGDAGADAPSPDTGTTGDAGGDAAAPNGDAAAPNGDAPAPNADAGGDAPAPNGDAADAPPPP